MKTTKYEHACLIVEDGTNKLVIDPGGFTTLPRDLRNINMVIVTEEHGDHYNLANLKQILAASPQAAIYTTSAVHDLLEKEGIKSSAVTGGETVKLGNTDIKLCPVDHAPVFNDSPCRSMTVQIGNYLYYPSDSFEPTNDEVEILALPTSGPWLKAKEYVEFAKKVRSKKIMPTHNGLNNDVANNMAAGYVEQLGREIIDLRAGESHQS